MQTAIICAGKNEQFSFAKSIGIGLVEASMGLTQFVLENKVQNLIFIGTCGVYKNDIALLEIYESKHCFNIEASSLTNDFYSPLQNEINLNVSYETTKCNSSNYICTDKNIAEKFAHLGLEIENMESFAVLSIAARFQIPATCFLCATNFCDSKAHQLFIQNHAQAKKNLEHFLQEKNLI